MSLKGPMLAVAVAAVASVAASAPRGGKDPGLASQPSSNPVWREVKWPFLMDQWGRGRAFQCAAADCGAELNVYVRPKIGFCNCTTGVADDAELDRVGDVDLLGPRFAPLGEGRAIAVAWMKGRSRAYAVDARGTALAIAFNDRCDVVVATVVGKSELPPAAEPIAVEFLNTQPMLRWVEVSLGL